MKNILIVEDIEQKAASIRSVIEEAGNNSVVVDVEVCVNGAREKLRQKRYELVVLDLAIPVIAGAEADPNGGIKLLEEIDTTALLIRPSCIVGLTGFEDLLSQYRDQFASRLWSIDFYDAAEGHWRERLAAKVRYLVSVVRNQYRSDVCVVTALEVELDPVLAWQADWSVPQALDETSFYFSGSVGGGDISVAAAACSRKGMVAATLLTAKLISEFSPRLVIMPGICAGVRGKVDIGDILVADPCWNWQEGRLEPSGTLFSPHQLDLAPEIQSRMRLLMRDNSVCREAYDSFAGEKPVHIPRIRLGPVATGSSVIADKTVISSIARQNRDYLGAEMEAYGVYAAAWDARSPKPRSLAIKSVCDFGELEKDDKFQRFSAHMSSFVAKVFIERFSGEIRSLGA